MLERYQYVTKSYYLVLINVRRVPVHEQRVQAGLWSRPRQPEGPPEEQALEVIRETLRELEVREELEALVSRHENSFTESRLLVID